MKIKSTVPAASHTAYLCLGSNLGERSDLLSNAMVLIGERCGQTVSRSKLYETEAWGSDSARDFLNQVICLRTALAPRDLLRELLNIEQRLGRERTGDRNADRHIDIDILFFDDLIVNEKELEIPHPRLHYRRFVLVALDEIAPGLVHPVFNKKISALLADCGDPLSVRPFVRPG